MKRKFELVVEHDNDPMNPRTDWDNITTIVSFHKRYDIGDKTDYKSSDFNSWDELKEQIESDHKVLLIKPLYMYDHSGITISTSPFGCNWDSGQVGWIFITNRTIKEEGIDESKVEEYLKSDVETYDQFIRGEVYGYRVFKVTECSLGHQHKEELDSCWGHYGEDECMKEGVSIMEYHISQEEVVV